MLIGKLEDKAYNYYYYYCVIIHLRIEVKQCWDTVIYDDKEDQEAQDTNFWGSSVQGNGVVCELAHSHYLGTTSEEVQDRLQNKV